MDLQLIDIFFVIRSDSLQCNEASKQKDSETSQTQSKNSKSLEWFPNFS